ncbi:MAG: molybdopterin-dependent oxidoreductase [Actinomycetota bacterium]
MTEYRNDADRRRAERYAALEAEAPVIGADEYRRRSRRSFLTGGLVAAAGYAGWRWVHNRPLDDRIPDVLRAGHEANEALWRTLSREQALAPTFDRSESSMIRVNGRHGIREEVDLDAWELRVLDPTGDVIGTHTMDDIRALPKVELTIEHKCVEGWSHIVTWGGARFSDFSAWYTDVLGDDLTDFVSMVTPDAGYYVGLDMPSMRNPQMLLAYELQGEPLDSEHGAPLRLATPNKYGIKCIKRIGTIQFTNEQPTDYWFERGYDWYAQL